MGHQRQYVRRTGVYMLAFNATHPDYGLPYGVYPRLLFAWICTEAVRTKTPRLVLGRSLNEFLTTLGIKSSNSRGKWDVRTHVIRQMQRLFGCVIYLEVREKNADIERVQPFISGIAEIQNLWWDPRDPEVQMLWTSSIELNHRLFREIVEHAVPLDMRILRAIRRSPLGIDLYMLITNHTYQKWSRRETPQGALARTLRAGRKRAEQTRNKGRLQIPRQRDPRAQEAEERVARAALQNPARDLREGRLSGAAAKSGPGSRHRRS